ncbi:MAG: DUF3579 domain-containing protein [Gammaproteobacteria bacterium]|nr:DUF3579 domain-containing protein [Gammaproteobacteria bacterium]
MQSANLVYPIYAIQGISTCREVLRPTDWAQRFAGNFSTFDKGRIQYSKHIYPSTIENVTSLICDSFIEEAYPLFWKEIMAFAKNNCLIIFIKNDPFSDFTVL